MRRFELVDDSSDKFWEIHLDGHLVTVSFGRIGTSGRKLNKTFDSDQEACAHFEKQIVEKTRKGYLEVPLNSDVQKNLGESQDGKEQKFWKLLKKCKTDSEGELGTQLEILEERLSKFSDGDLAKFADFVDDKIARAERWDIWAAAYLDNGGCSDDGFIDWRGGLVLAGEKAYSSVLANPDNLANFEVYFAEEFNYLPAQIWRERHNDKPMPREFKIENYPGLEGEPFVENDQDWFRSNFPKLSKKKELEAGNKKLPASNNMHTVTVTVTCNPNERRMGPEDGLGATPQQHTTTLLYVAIRKTFGDASIICMSSFDFIIKAQTDNLDWAMRALPETINSVPGDHSNVRIVYGDVN